MKEISKSTSILELLTKYKRISIIGMDKNVGKTTTLNKILKEARGNFSLGLTSIGRDGEEKDRVTGTEKPRIYVEQGTYIATAKQCLFHSDITKEIMATTGIHTPMGEVILLRALSDGYVDLGGPSLNKYMLQICNELEAMGSELVIVDGALSRKTFASPAITEATILSTGASLSGNIQKVVAQTKHTVNLLSIEQEAQKEVLPLAQKIMEQGRIGTIDQERNVKMLDVLTSLEASREIVEHLNDQVTHVVIKGVLSDKLLEDIMKTTDLYKGVTFLVEDGTKLFIREETLYKFTKQGGRIKVVAPIHIACVTCNPKSPYGYEFNPKEFLEALQKEIKVPVLDVIGGA